MSVHKVENKKSPVHFWLLIKWTRHNEVLKMAFSIFLYLYRQWASIIIFLLLFIDSFSRKTIIVCVISHVWSLHFPQRECSGCRFLPSVRTLCPWEEKNKANIATSVIWLHENHISCLCCLNLEHFIEYSICKLFPRLQLSPVFVKILVITDIGCIVLTWQRVLLYGRGGKVFFPQEHNCHHLLVQR